MTDSAPINPIPQSFARVFLFPTETFSALYLIVQRATGVIYEHQYGGTATLQGAIEGYLIPLWQPDSHNALRKIFESDLRRSGLWGSSASAEKRAAIAERLAPLVEAISISSDYGEEPPVSLRIDLSRIEDLDEAWIPVTSPMGPGVVVWCNSD